MKKEELREKVLDYLLTIPAGKVTTYKAIGEVFEVHPRRVGQVIKTNMIPEHYPCYKVMEREDKIGFYNGLGGIPGKVQRMKDDGVEVIKGKIDAKYFV